MRWRATALGLTLIATSWGCGTSSKGDVTPAGAGAEAASGNGGTNVGGVATSGSGGSTNHGGDSQCPIPGSNDCEAGRGGNANMGGAGGAGGTNAAGTGGTGGAGGANPFAPDFSMGHCVPKGPATDDVPGLVVLAAGDFFNNVESFALQGTTVYYKMHDGGIMRRARGGQPEVVVNNVGTVWDMFVHGDYLYWINNNQRTLMRASLATLPATAESILPNVSDRWWVDDGATFYFGGFNKAGLYKLPFAEAVPGGGATPTQVTPMNLGPISIADGQIYYVTNQAAYALPIAGGQPKVVMSLGGLREVLVAGDTLYGAADEDIFKRPLASNSQMVTPLARGNLISADTTYRVNVQGPLLDGDRVYYREEFGPVAWVKTDGSDCRLLADYRGKGTENMKTALDADYVYFIEKDTRLLAVPK